MNTTNILFATHLGFEARAKRGEITTRETMEQVYSKFENICGLVPFLIILSYRYGHKFFDF